MREGLRHSEVSLIALGSFHPLNVCSQIPKIFGNHPFQMVHFISIICSIQDHSKNLYAETKGYFLLKEENSSQHYIWQIKYKNYMFTPIQKLFPI